MKFWLRAQSAGLGTICVTVLLASCQVPPSRPGPTVPGPATPAVAPLSGRVYRVVAAESEVRVLVYRGGTMAKLGHNHVIASHDLLGIVTLPEDPAQASFEIAMPVESLSVDEPEKRAEEGPEFVAPVNDSARTGTHKNMMKPEVLDGGNFPAITVRSTRITRTGDDYNVVFEVELRSLKHELAAPVHVVFDDTQLTATGELAFKQSALGITPFTAALGALAIKDEVRLKFNIHASVSER